MVPLSLQLSLLTSRPALRAAASGGRPRPAATRRSPGDQPHPPPSRSKATRVWARHPYRQMVGVLTDPGILPPAAHPGGVRSARKAATFVGLALDLYLIIRAVAEPFVIDMSNPATYRNDWGGPSLFGRPPGSLRTRRGSSRSHRNVPDPSSFLWARPARAAWPTVGLSAARERAASGRPRPAASWQSTTREVSLDLEVPALQVARPGIEHGQGVKFRRHCRSARQLDREEVALRRAEVPVGVPHDDLEAAQR
jgi:hypothetical protein